MKTEKKLFTTQDFVLLSLLVAVLLVMAFTPLGRLPIGPLVATLNMVPVAIAAVAIGPAAGAVAGLVWGLSSYGLSSGLVGIMFSYDPLRTFILCVVPRVLDGILLGLLFRAARKKISVYVSATITGFMAAFLNTLFFMSALVLLFGQTEYMQEKIGGQNIILFICGFVGINAVFEMVVSTILTTAVIAALAKAGMLSRKAVRA
ncbi:MAG: ECF transporter S component [Lachnospiraceae bacterium]|nr:ECF transporter S component [Lachnospiraceae bacterium]